MAFLIDSSGSIIEDGRKPENWLLALNFVVKIIDSLRIGNTTVRVAAAEFSLHVKENWDFFTYFTENEYKYATWQIPHLDSWTNTAQGLELVKRNFYDNRRDDNRDTKYRDVLIVLTDGNSNIRPENTLINANALKDMGVQIICIGITDQVNWVECKLMASNIMVNGVSTPLILEVSNYAALVSSLSDLLSAVCTLQTLPPVILPQTETTPGEGGIVLEPTSTTVRPTPPRFGTLPPSREHTFPWFKFMSHIALYRLDFLRSTDLLVM